MIKYSFALQTKMSLLNAYGLSLLIGWILQALCQMLSEHAEVKVNATDNGFKLSCVLGENQNQAPQMSKYAHI